MNANDIFYATVASIALGVAIGIVISNLVEIIKDIKQ